MATLILSEDPNKDLSIERKKMVGSGYLINSSGAYNLCFHQFKKGINEFKNNTGIYRDYDFNAISIEGNNSPFKTYIFDGNQKGFKEFSPSAISEKLQIDFEKIKSAKLLDYYSFSNELSDFLSCCALEKLDLSNNSNKEHFKALPKSIFEFKGLKMLDLSENYFYEIPEEIGNLKELTELNLSSNLFYDIPESMQELKKLKKLYLNDNIISSFMVLKNAMRKINGGENESSIPWGRFSRFGSSPDEYTLSDFKRKLAKNEFAYFMDLFSKLDIRMEGGKLRDINHMNKPYELKNLYCKKSSEIPKSINTSGIPESIGKMESLEILRLGGNWLYYVPECISRLKSLKEISLNSCSIFDIDESFSKLDNLETLDLCSNKFKKIPECVWDLKNLKKIIVSEKFSDKIPKDLRDGIEVVFY